MTTNIFQGDLRLILSENGSELLFIGGQPVMDGGIENVALISLFTSQGWAGNELFRNPDQKIGSDFEQSTRQPITFQALNDIRDAAEKALADPVFGEVVVEVSNPIDHIIEVNILIKPPGQDVQQLALSKYSDNWRVQAISPANERV